MVTKTSENFQAFIFISLKKKKKKYIHIQTSSQISEKKWKGYILFLLTAFKTDWHNDDQPLTQLFKDKT